MPSSHNHVRRNRIGPKKSLLQNDSNVKLIFLTGDVAVNSDLGSAVDTDTASRLGVLALGFRHSGASMNSLLQSRLNVKLFVWPLLNRVPSPAVLQILHIRGQPRPCCC